MLSVRFAHAVPMLNGKLNFPRAKIFCHARYTPESRRRSRSWAFIYGECNLWLLDAGCCNHQMRVRVVRKRFCCWQQSWAYRTYDCYYLVCLWVRVEWGWGWFGRSRVMSIIVLCHIPFALFGANKKKVRCLPRIWLLSHLTLCECRWGWGWKAPLRPPGEKWKRNKIKFVICAPRNEFRVIILRVL